MHEAYLHKTCKTLTKCRKVMFRPNTFRHVKGKSSLFIALRPIKIGLLTDGCQSQAKSDLWTRRTYTRLVFLGLNDQ